MTTSGLLGTALTATTNPNPNTLGTPSPFPIPYVNAHKVSAAWISQASKALFPRQAMGPGYQVPLQVQFVPSSGTAVYTVTMWQWNQLAQAWVLPKDNSSFTL